MGENKPTNGIVSIDEAMSITAGTLKYQKIMCLVIMLGPSAIAPIIVCSSLLIFTYLSSEFTKSGSNVLDTLWVGQEITFFRNAILAGVILGSLSIPSLADLFGRKRIIKIFSILNAFCLTLVALSVNLLMLMIAGFAIGICFVGVFVVGIVLCTETVDFKHRAWYMCLYMIAYLISPIISILLFILGINLRVIIMFYAFLALLEHFLLKYVVESPRFLLTNSVNIEKCTKALNKISLMNGEGHFSYSLESENKRKYITVTFKDIYRSRMNIIKLISCSVIWIADLLTYYLTLFTMPHLLENPDIQIIIINLITISSTVTAGYLIDSYGRKKTLFYFLLIDSALFLGISLVSFISDNDILFFTLFLVLNFVIGVVYIIILISTAEQFPTYVRCTCFGISMMFGRIGTVIAVNFQILGLDQKIYISTLVIGILILCISPAAILLEETHHKELDEMAENTQSVLLLDKNRY